jgi:hypothetical protein
MDLSPSRYGIWEARLADNGPLYTETYLDRPIAEPFNAVSALVFLVIGVCWMVRLRGRYKRNAFFMYCIFLLAAGGVGGTLFHATRASRWFLIADFAPIAIIIVSVGAFLWGRLLGRGPAVGVGIVVVMLLATFGLRGLVPRSMAISFSYFLLSLVVVVPLMATLRVTRGRDAGYVFCALPFFLTGLLFRMADGYKLTASVLPMGSHWLWHSFSAVSVAVVLEYFYRYTTAKD